MGDRFGEVSERFKEPVLKTGDSVMGHGFESHPLRHTTLKQNGDHQFCLMEKYSSGRRGAPAKGVGVLKRARVQIPPSPPKRTVEIVVISAVLFCFCIFKHEKERNYDFSSVLALRSIMLLSAQKCAVMS